MREKFLDALADAFRQREELWLFGSEEPVRLSALAHPPGWESWPEELKELHLQLTADREAAVKVITRKNRLLSTSDQLQHQLERATDPASREYLQEQINALVEPLRSAEQAVAEVKEAVRQKERTLRLAFLSHAKFQIVDIAKLTPEQRQHLDSQLDEHESSMRKRMNRSGDTS